jgi:hypothetical protein
MSCSFPVALAGAFFVLSFADLFGQQVAHDEAYAYVYRLAQSGEGFTNPPDLERHLRVRSDPRDWESALAQIIDAGKYPEEVIDSALAVLNLRGKMSDPKVEEAILPYLKYRIDRANTLKADKEQFRIGGWGIPSLLGLLVENGGEATMTAALNYIISPEEIDDPLLSVDTLRSLSKTFAIRADTGNLLGLQSWLKIATDSQVRENVGRAIHRAQRTELGAGTGAMTDHELPKITKAGSIPQAVKTAPESKPTASTPSDEPAASTSWSVIVILIAAASGLLWLLFKAHKLRGLQRHRER